MYDEFPTIYETTLKLNWVYFVIFGILVLLLLIILLVSLAKIFKKANRSGISAFIPFYNLIVLLEITNSPKWYFIFLIIPVVNVFFYISVMISLAKFFRKTKPFTLGLILLPFIFYPILGFGDSEYIGINLIAINGKSVNVDIPKIVEDEGEKEPIVHEEKDQSLENINISIGGGVYQKDYTNSLLKVDKGQTISEKPNLIVKKRTAQPQTSNNNIDSTNVSFIAPIVEESLPKEEGTTNLIHFPEPIGINLNTNKNSSINSNIPYNKTQNSHMDQVNVGGLNEPTINSQLAEKSEFVLCPKCGTKIKRDAKVCFLCGNQLN